MTPHDEAGLSDDALLGGRISLLQPQRGVRATADTLLLAAAIPARAGEHALELGCGSGGAALALAARVPGLFVLGIDIDADMIALACRNAARNGLADRVAFRVSAVTGKRVPCDRHFDHVLANPPWYEAGRASPSPECGRARGFVESAAQLSDWIDFALRALKPRGRLAFILRAERLDAAIAALHGRAGEVEIFPLWPRIGVAAKAVILRARKGVRGPARIAPGLVLHEKGGRFTAAAARILREAAPLSDGILPPEPARSEAMKSNGNDGRC